MKKRILFFIWALEVGGAERLLVKLVRLIPRDRFDVKVVCLTRKGVWAQEVEDGGIEVVSMDKRVGFDPWILPRLVVLLRREKPDLVNTHLWTADLWARLAAVIARVPRIVVTEQNVDVWKRWYHRVIDRILFNWTDRVICVSDQVVEFYTRELKVPSQKTAMIPNAIDLAPFHGASPPRGLREEIGSAGGEFLFVCAARLHPQKRHCDLFEAARLLLAMGCGDFRLLIVGEGSLREELERLSESKGLKSRIHFLGLRQDIPSILLQSDAFVLASDYEGLPLAILEAMAAGLPIVATNVGGVPQVVDDGGNGYLVAPRDPGSLADAMARVAADRETSRRMGDIGKLRVSREYSIENVAARTVDLFDECLQDRIAVA